MGALLVKKFNSFVFGVFAFFSFALVQTASASPLPLNNLNQQDNPRVLYNISPQQFKQLIDRVIGTFSPVVRSHGGELRAGYFWNDSTVNAFASRSGNIWTVNMYGGLARRKEITPDGFTLVVCHELGHHLAGYPFKYSVSQMGNPWASAEGESDYFAAHTCTRVIWGRDWEENARHRYTVDPVAKKYCDRSLSNQMDRDLCYRTADAGQSLGNLLNALRNSTRAIHYQDARNTLFVPRTDVSHPEAQCRLETYLNGAICRRPFDLRVIPGLDVHLSGGSPLEEEKDAAKYSCGEHGASYDGSRPRCWFQPLLPSWY